MSKYKSNSKRVCEVFKSTHHKNSRDAKFFFRVKRRGNGEIIASSEGYSRKIDCIKTAKTVTGGRLKITIIK